MIDTVGSVFIWALCHPGRVLGALLVIALGSAVVVVLTGDQP